MKTTPICNYCGNKWPSVKGDLDAITPETRAEISAHIAVCDKNPYKNAMRWHKLADEKPTEAGLYVTWDRLRKISRTVGRVFYASEIDHEIKKWEFDSVEYWLLITPPEREEK